MRGKRVRGDCVHRSRTGDNCNFNLYEKARMAQAQMETKGAKAMTEKNAKFLPRLTISCSEGKNHDEPRVTGWHGWDGFPYVEHTEYISKEESDHLRSQAVAELEARLKKKDEEIERLSEIEEIAKSLVTRWYREPPVAEGGNFLAEMYRLRNAVGYNQTWNDYPHGG